MGVSLFGEGEEALGEWEGQEGGWVVVEPVEVQKPVSRLSS